MRYGYLLALSLLLVAALAALPAAAGTLDAGEAVQAYGAFSYRTDLSSDVKSFQVLDANGDLLASLDLSFDPEGTLMDFRKADGTHLSVLLGRGRLAVTDRRTGEVEVLTAKWGEVNRGEGIELIERHRNDLSFLRTLHVDLMEQVFEGEARLARELAGAQGDEDPAFSADLGSLGGEELTSLPQEIMDLPGNCRGVTVHGYGLSIYGSIAHARYLAEQAADAQCTNQWCWGCCEWISTTCYVIVDWVECIHRARSCAAPCV